jgi:2,3-bisphosphoglycerate-dependent phosphoglycerate mutase
MTAPVSDGIELVFETHSTSEDNERGIATGWLGGALSAAGREQARQLGERRRDDGIDVVVSSDLNRAVETAWIAFAGSRISVALDWRLRECDYGELDGMPRSQLDAERSRRLTEPFPGGESWEQAVARVAGFLDELAHSDRRRVLLIGHVATRFALDHHLRGVPLDALVDRPFAWQEGWEYVLPALRIRELQANELARVDRDLPLNRLDQHLETRSTYLVAWEGNEPRGHAHIAWTGTKLDVPEIQDVFVLPEHRRRGIARELTAAAEEAARTRGWSTISLSVSRAGNVPARRLYEKLGYRDAGVAPVRVSGTIMLRGRPFEVDDTLVYLTKELAL